MTKGPSSIMGDHARTLIDAEQWAERAYLAETTVAGGGALVPPMLDPALVLVNQGTLNAFRGIVRIATIATQTWKGTTTQGVSAEMAAEAAEAADASPSFVQPTINTHRADGWVAASYEVLQDTNIATEVSMLFADARDRLEGTKILKGAGDGSNEPMGLLTELQANTASRVNSNTNGTLGTVDVYALDSALPARYRLNAGWLASPGIYNTIRQLATGPSQYQSGFWADFAPGTPSTLIGHPTHISSDMLNALSTATVSNDDCLIVSDFRQSYLLVDRIGMTVANVPVLLGSNRRPSGQTGWLAFWRFGGDSINVDAARCLRV